MKKILLVLLIALLGSCKPESEPKQEIPPPIEAKALVTRNFDSAQIISKYKISKKLLGGATFEDNSGSYDLIVAEEDLFPEGPQGNFFLQVLSYSLFKTDGGKDSLMIQVSDTAENWCDRGLGLVTPITVADNDGDNIAEVYFIYNVFGNCDVSPMLHKLIMINNGIAATLTGNSVVWDSKDKFIGGAKKFDANFERLSPLMREIASEFWNKNIKSEKAY